MSEQELETERQEPQREEAAAPTGTTAVDRQLTVDPDGGFKYSETVLSTEPTSELQKVSDHFNHALRVSLNASPAKPLMSKSVLPVLPEQTVTAYKKGVKEELRAVVVDGFKIEKFTAYDFLLMRRAALRDGINLAIVSAFRDNETQKRIRAQRHNPDGSLNAVGKVKGPAARPGFSNHQSGIALDIRVKMTMADKRNGAFTAEYLWLVKNGARYGFDNGEVPEEPWHWRHQERALVAQLEAGDSIETLAALVNAGVAAGNVLTPGRSDLGDYLARNLHDRTQSFSRAAEAATTSRSTFLANAAESSLRLGNSIANYISRHTQTAAVAAKAPERGMNPSTLAPLEFDFESGTWGDEELV